MWTGSRARTRVRASTAVACLAVATTTAVTTAALAAPGRDRADWVQMAMVAAPRVGDPVLRGRAAPPANTPGPLRFFTINEVLAKHDRDAAVAVPVALHPAEPSAAAPAAAPVVPLDEPFGLAGFRAPDGTIARKWSHARAELDDDARTVRRCLESDDCSPAARRFLALSGDARRNPDDLLERVNLGVNGAVRYQSDIAHHGVADRWSSPLETLGRTGDCEDYAIAKYALLVHLGVPEADMRIVLLRDIVIREDHAVLAVRRDGRWMILDNRRGALVSDAALPHYAALAALSGEGVKLLAAPLPVPAGDAAPPANPSTSTRVEGL